MDQNRSYREIALEILREAEETDRREDELYGKARGDELPEQLRTREGRKAALADAKRRLRERKGRAAEDQAEGDQVAELVVDPQPALSGHGGRREWFRVARRQLEDHRAQQAEPVARDREERLIDAAGRLEQNLDAELAANDLYEQWRAGRRIVAAEGCMPTTSSSIWRRSCQKE